LGGPNTTFWPVLKDEKKIGQVTSAIYSPRLKRNIALAMVSTDYAKPGTQVDVLQTTATTNATIVNKPFYDPRKKIASE